MSLGAAGRRENGWGHDQSRGIENGNMIDYVVRTGLDILCTAGDGEIRHVLGFPQGLS